MRRHPALQDLSRDHFTALNQVVEVKRVVEDNQHAKPLDSVWAAFLRLTGEELPPHFDEEEAHLLPLLETEERREYAERLQSDHARLVKAFAGLRAMRPDIQPLWNAAEDLRLHIRWEEDELFERLQAWLSEAELDALWERSKAFREQEGRPVGPG